MFFSIRYTAAVALVAFAIIASGTAKAAMHVFPDQMTTNLVYSPIEETNTSIIMDFTYYGGVGTSGEALTFAANEFRVESFGGVEAIDARVSFTITAKPGQLIHSVTVTEGGRAAAFGEGSFVDVHSGGFALIDGFLSDSKSDHYSLPAPAVGLATDFWELSYTFNFDPTDEVSISLDNALFAFAIPDPNGYAYIDKKGVIINVGLVPEPSSALALLVASGVGVCVRRRRR
jgi:hypothetical protein